MSGPSFRLVVRALVANDLIASTAWLIDVVMVRFALADDVKVVATRRVPICIIHATHTIARPLSQLLGGAPVSR